MPKARTKSNKDDSDNKKSKATKKTTNTIDENKEMTDARNEQSTVISVPAVASSHDMALEDASDLLNKDNLTDNHDEPLVEIKYDEPVLTSIIVECYEGEKVKGLFEGVGKAVYQGGNTYEGEFRQGLMHGSGKYTWVRENVAYEGTFKDNEITGAGKYTWFDLKFPGRPATYDGEVYQGRRHGEGVFKSGRTSMMYSGGWMNGKRNGKGKMIYDAEGRSFYEGDWINNKKFGWGRYQYLSGNVYEGMWVNDIRHGEGTMRWFDKNQVYTGQWENGVQNGLGEHSWYLARIDMTQYCLRNTYYGSFKNGKREGQGTFLYADGSKYEGTWEKNLKSGWGKYTSKDGKIFESYFEDDKITDSPKFKKSSVFAAEINQVNTRLPSAGTTLNINSAKSSRNVNKIEFHLNLDLSSILDDFETELKQDLEKTQAHKTIIRYLDLFKQIYRYYSQLGFDSSPDNTYVLNRMQFWRFLLDCKVHLNDDFLTLIDFDRYLNPNMNPNDLHCPYDKIIQREFLNYIVLTAYHLYKDKFDNNSSSVLSWCIEKLIVDNLLPYSCNVQGQFYLDSTKTLSILTYMVRSYEIYRYICSKRNGPIADWSITMRKLLMILDELKLLNGKLLTAKEVVEIMATENPIVYDSENCYNLELEITFLEFFEILIQCAAKSFHKLKLKESSSNILTESHNDRNTLSESKDLFQNGGEETAVNSNERKSEEKILTEKEATNEAKSELTETDILPRQMQNTMSYDRSMTNNLNNTEDSTKEKSMDVWNEQNSYFFLNNFLPAAESYINIKKLSNATI